MKAWPGKGRRRRLQHRPGHDKRSEAVAEGRVPAPPWLLGVARSGSEGSRGSGRLSLVLRPDYVPRYWLFAKHADGSWPGPWSALARLVAPGLAGGLNGVVLLMEDHYIACAVVGLVTGLLSVVQLLLFGPHALRALRSTQTE